MNHAVLIITIIGLTSLASQSAVADSKKTMEVFIQLLDEAEKIHESNVKRQINELNSKETYSSQPSVVSPTSFRWPTRGGLEDWGFQRPNGCQSGNAYELPLAEKMQKYSNWGGVSGIHVHAPNEYTTGRTGQMIRQTKGNAQAVAALQGDIDKIETELKQLDEDGESYIQLTSTSLQNGADVIKAIKRFEIVGQRCGNMDGNGAANAIACGLQSKAFEITAHLERFVQIACHLGLNTPTYQVANVVSNSPVSTGNNNNSQPQLTPQKNQSEPQKVAAYSSQHLGAYNEKYQDRGKKHNSDAEASKCLRFDTGRKQILNDCDFAVEALFCAINPNNPNSIHAFEMAPYFNCAENSIGMWPVGGKSPLIGKFSSESVAMFACKKPSIPGAKYNHDSKSFSGRCSEYLSDTEPDILQYDAPF